MGNPDLTATDISPWPRQLKGTSSCGTSLLPPAEKWAGARANLTEADVNRPSAEPTERPARTAGQIVTDEGQGGVALAGFLAAEKFI